MQELKLKMQGGVMAGIRSRLLALLKITIFISVSPSELAIVDTRKHFSNQLPTLEEGNGSGDFGQGAFGQKLGPVDDLQSVFVNPNQIAALVVTL